MFKNILVPTDLTEKSLVALDIALKMNTESDFKITLLHVIETLEEAEDEDFREFYEKLEKRAWMKLDEMLQRYGWEDPQRDRFRKSGSGDSHLCP